MTSKYSDDDSEEEEVLNYGGRLDGMSQQERGRLWNKLKTSNRGPCIQKRALLRKLSRMPKLARKISRAVYFLMDEKKSIVDELKDQVEKDPEAKLSISDFIRWLDPRPREKKKKEEMESIEKQNKESVVSLPPPPPISPPSAAKNVTSISKPATRSRECKEKTIVFTCRKCRFRLFTIDDLESHQVGKHTFEGLKSSFEVHSSKKCHSVFVKEPPKWMNSDTVSSASANRIHCPKCNAKVGNASWVGTQCSCGTWVTPAFQFSKGKIDAKRRRKMRCKE